MRILYWTELFWPYIGGVEVLASEFIPEMRGRGFEFEVITSHGALNLPDEEMRDGLCIHRLPFHTALADRDVAAVADCLARTAAVKKRFDPSIVHVNLTDASVFFHLRTSRADRAATVVSTRLSIGAGSDHIDSLLLDALRLADRITTVSRAMLEELLQIEPDVADRASVIYNGLPMPATDRDDLPFSEPVVLFVGRLVPEKGADLAIRALPMVLRSCPRASLWIAGDGPERPSLEHLAREHEVEDRVSFLGWIAPDQVHAMMNRATCVVVPSRWKEAFGQVALQAAQMKRPVVATRVGGLPEVVADGGIVVDPEDPDALAQGIREVLLDPERSVRMGEIAHRRAADTFGWQRYLGEYERLYRSLKTLPPARR